jgi:hypothetical protein
VRGALEIVRPIVEPAYPGVAATSQRMRGSPAVAAATDEHAHYVVAPAIPSLTDLGG